MNFGKLAANCEQLGAAIPAGRAPGPRERASSAIGRPLEAHRGESAAIDHPGQRPLRTRNSARPGSCSSLHQLIPSRHVMRGHARAHYARRPHREVPTISPIPSGPARVNAVTLHPSPAEVRRSWFAEHPSQVSLASPSASSLPAALPGRSMMHSKPRPSRRSGEKLRLSSKRRSGTLQLSAKRRLGRRKKR